MKKSLPIFAVLFTFSILFSMSFVSAFSFSDLMKNWFGGSVTTGKAVDASGNYICAPGQLIGDVNGDGKVLGPDADALADYIVGNKPLPSDICCFDANKDGQITTGDKSTIRSIAQGYTSSPGACPGGIVCGDGKKEGSEACDDGNTTNGDGCSSTCTTETPVVICTDSDINAMYPDGKNLLQKGYITVGAAKYDDYCAGAVLYEQVCISGVNASVRTECGTGYSCKDGACIMNVNVNNNTVVTINATNASVVANSSVCGNGKLESEETCDDGNAFNGDGCSGLCKREDIVSLNSSSGKSFTVTPFSGVTLVNNEVLRSVKLQGTLNGSTEIELLYSFNSDEFSIKEDELKVYYCVTTSRESTICDQQGLSSYKHFTLDTRSNIVKVDAIKEGIYLVAAVTCGNLVCQVIHGESAKTCAQDCRESNGSGGSGEGGNGTVVCKDGCNLDSKCVPYGTRKKGEYCSIDANAMVDLRAENAICENHYECGSNVCLDGKCVESGLIQKFIEWLKKLFGGSDESLLYINHDIGNFEYTSAVVGSGNEEPFDDYAHLYGKVNRGASAVYNYNKQNVSTHVKVVVIEYKGEIPQEEFVSNIVDEITDGKTRQGVDIDIDDVSDLRLEEFEGERGKKIILFEDTRSLGKKTVGMIWLSGKKAVFVVLDDYFVFDGNDKEIMDFITVYLKKYPSTLVVNEDIIREVENRVGKMAECIDSDINATSPDGKNYFVRGTITGINEEGSYYSFTDSCPSLGEINYGVLQEYSCTGSGISMGTGYNCTQVGASCRDGKCLTN